MGKKKDDTGTILLTVLLTVGIVAAIGTSIMALLQSSATEVEGEGEGSPSGFSLGGIGEWLFPGDDGEGAWKNAGDWWRDVF
jgi:hypothetical protein